MADYTKDPNLIATHLGDDYDRYLNSVIPPVFMNSLHVLDSIESYTGKAPASEYFYGRVSNPTVEIAEKKIAALEHGKYAVVFGSGMAAATAAIETVCNPGDHIICVKGAYVEGFINKFGVNKLSLSATFVTGKSLEEIENAVQPNTTLIVLETPVSLVFSLQDIEGVAKIAKKHGIKTYIDNSYCTPLLQNPLDLGIDMVMHTSSKYLGGHSDIIGGALVSNDEDFIKEIRDFRGSYGSIMGPMEAWIMIRGMRTLEARLKRHQETAMAVARYLEANEHVRVVHYPALESHPQHELAMRQQRGCSGLMSFELNTKDDEQVYEFVHNLEIFQVGVSWGGFESLVCTPLMRGTEEDALKAGAQGRELVRIHCGLEGADNLIAALDKAFKAAFK